MRKRTPRQLHRRLERLAGRRLDLTLTANATSYLCCTGGRGPLRLRLHRAFLYAPDDVLAALGRWLGGRTRSCPRAVQDFVDRPPPEAARAVRRLLRPPPEPRGRCHDLGRLLRQVNARYLGGKARVRIAWGRVSSRQAVRARTLGAYYHHERLIVMSPVLDQWDVPQWFIAFTVYHELLHAVQPADEPPHGRWFDRALRRHPHHDAAERWERAHTHLLTRRPPSATRPATRRLHDLHEHLDF